ncbi:MAG: T9SS type A sorting domain-containing protein [Ignavibacteria bacterium]
MKKFIFAVCIVLIPVLYFSFNYNIESEEQELAPGYDWFEMQRAYPFDEIPYSERLQSLEYVKNYMPRDKSINSNWTLAGPINIEGRITTIAIDPANPQIVYAGSANGGVWKSTNFCLTWTSIFDNQNTSSIGALAIDPTNTNIIYCGTGEANSLRSHYPGTGMYKSTNGGTSWTFIGLPNSFNIGNIAINPTNTQEIYSAVLGATRRKTLERGLYKSTNGGLNWTNTLFISDSVGVVDVAIDPTNPNKLFAAAWERLRREDYIKYGGVKSALYVSSNSGVNWTAVNNGFPYNDPTLGRISIDIARSNTNTVYALLADANGNSKGLYKSTDGGNIWSIKSTTVAPSSNYAWFNRICKVHPTNPDIVYCGGLDMMYSINGGTSFNYAGESHVDQHAVAFSLSNPNYVVVGNDGGIDWSTNGGSTWGASLTLPITQFYAGDINYQNPVDLMGGAQDNGCIRTSNGGMNWFQENGGDGFYTMYDYVNPLNMYAASQNGYLVRSTNGGASFLSGTSGLDLTYTNWSTPYIMDKTNPLIMYCGTYKIFKSTNGMASWLAISPDMANAHVANLGTVTTLDVSKSNPNVLYCGTDDANVWVTTNGGTNWTKVNAGLPNRWVTRLAVHPDSANICYVTLSGYKIDSTGAHIYKTTNYGNTWISKKGNLPDAPVNDIIIDPRKYSNLYAGTDYGVMVSTNDGTDWAILGGGLPSSVPVHDLTFHLPSLKLVAWTHGRSAMAMTLPPITNIIKTGETAETYRLSECYPNPFNSQTVIKYSLPKSTNISINIYDVTGRKISTLLSGNQSKGEYRVNWDAGNLASGIYYINMSSAEYSRTVKALLVK